MTEQAPAIEADNAEPATPNAEAVKPEAEKAAEPTTTSTQSWRDRLPDDLKADPSLAKFQTEEGLARSYLNAEKLIGTEKIPIPKTEEDWDRWYKAAGRPENPDGYGFAAPEQVPDGLVYNPELDKRLAGISHKAGLNKQQAETLRTELMEIVKEGGAEQLQATEASKAESEKARVEAEKALKDEWGSAYDQRAAIAGKAKDAFLPPETVAKLEAAGVGNDPALVKALYNMGVKLAGEKQLLGDVRLEQSPGDLDSAIANHRNKFAGELTDKTHPDHALRVQELTTLYNKRFG